MDHSKSHWRDPAESTRFLHRSDVADGQILLQLVSRQSVSRKTVVLIATATCTEASAHVRPHCTIFTF